ncbi:MAG: AAA family ATPase [bacterium]|nr:AAA family ATPase [bacterium]
MISNWTLKNFKSIRDETTFNLSPLTVIAGTNSSGKSTVLQSILLISQTLQSRFKKQQLILNGELTKLGTPENLLHFETPNNSLIIKGGLDAEQNSKRLKQIEFNLEFDLKSSRHVSLLTLNNFFFGNGTYFIRTIRMDSSISDEQKIVDVRLKTQPHLDATFIFSQFLPDRFRYPKPVAEVFKDELNELDDLMTTAEFREDALEGDFNLPLGREIAALLNLVANRLSNVENLPSAIIGCTTRNDLLALCIELMHYDKLVFQDFKSNFQSIPLRKQIEASAEDDNILVNAALPKELKEGIDVFKVYFQDNIHYLGPLRDDPRVIYAIPNNIDFRHVGLKGEFTAAMLTLYGMETVTYPVTASTAKPEMREGTLIEAISFWLSHMGLADSLNVKELTNIGYQLNIQQSKLPNDLSLTNIGVGVSQVLPTLVMCLLVPSPCTLLIEQPELHLHPRVQSILGDFFLGLTYMGKQVIVETHSEHIINRLFLRIAQDGVEQKEETELLERIGILFVEKEGTVSRFREVKPNEFGVISEDDWPKGFLDQSMLEIQEKIKAAKEKRQNKKGFLGRK